MRLVSGHSFSSFHDEYKARSDIPFEGQEVKNPSASKPSPSPGSVYKFVFLDICAASCARTRQRDKSG